MQKFWTRWSRGTFLAVTLGLLVIPLVLWNVFKDDIGSTMARQACGVVFVLCEALALYIVITYAQAKRDQS